MQTLKPLSLCCHIAILLYFQTIIMPYTVKGWVQKQTISCSSSVWLLTHALLTLPLKNNMIKKLSIAPEMESFSVNIILDSSNSAKDDCSVTTIHFLPKHKIALWVSNEETEGKNYNRTRREVKKRKKNTCSEIQDTTKRKHENKEEKGKRSKRKKEKYNSSWLQWLFTMEEHVP